ncbi:MAG TPA: HEAT repeat domain-containing protein [Phycisphaerales bacterium]|nr:HEAT repeat domain-containing protein [Phycisphaerales bacterium]HMP37661.1 HEAT repeat domain-containing protein [Phycisphaerales bacterium]
MGRTRVAAALCLLLGALGCAPSPERGGFASADPGARLYAITDAARSHDRSALPWLVDSLWSEDPAVRFMAIETLRELTGTDCGYRLGDPPELRAAAIERWVALGRSEGWIAPASGPTEARVAGSPETASGHGSARSQGTSAHPSAHP